MFLLPSDPLANAPSDSGIYALVQASTGRAYVGRSNNLRLRLRAHRYFAKSATRLGRYECSYVYRALRADTGDGYAYILERGIPAEAIAEREAHWINVFSATTHGLGFNLAAPAPCVPTDPELRRRISAAQLGRVQSEVTREKISAACRGKRLSEAHREAIAAGQFGTHRSAPVSAETRAKISAAQKGRPRGPLTEQHCARISAGSYGKKKSEAHRARLSAVRKGVSHGPMSPEHKANIAAANKGRVFSDETRARMSESAKLRAREPRSAETRSKISAAIKAACAQKKASAAQSSLDTVGNQ